MPVILDGDYSLVQQVQAGIGSELIVKYQQKVFKQCYFLLNQNKYDAEDAVQEVGCLY